MRRKLLSLVAVLLLTCMVFTVPASAKIVDQTVTGTYCQSEARKMLDIVNDFRTGSEAFYINQDNTTVTTVPNLGKLKWDYDLEKAAMQRAAELIVSYSHTRPDGSTCFTALSDVNSVFLMGCGENIAYGTTGWWFDTAQEMFDGWKEDGEPFSGQGHRRNMLGRDFKTIGIACIQANGCNYWAMELSSGSSGAAATTANNSLTSVNVKTYVKDTVEEKPEDTGSEENWGENLSLGLPTLDGDVVMTTANGKAKVLVFTYNTGCWNSNNVISQLYAYNYSPDMVDIVICSSQPYNATYDWREEFGTRPNIVWAYNASSVSSQYRSKFKNWGTTPEIVYIDSANNIKGNTIGNVNISTEISTRLGLYPVTYNTNGGSGAPATQYKNIDVPLTLSSTVPTRSGYTFTGWNTASDGSGTAYKAGQAYTANSPLTLYAQWKAGSTLSITGQPASVSVASGNTATFKVTATGASSYQWQWRTGSTGTWTNCSSATTGYNTATLKPVGSATRNGYQYRCVVTNASGSSLISNTATLKVLAITTQPASQTVSANSTASFTVAATNAASYQWQWRTGSTGTWANCSSATAGYNTATLKPVGTSARNGYQYRCVVKDASGNSVTSNTATLTVKASITITTQPASTTVTAGNTATFKVVATGASSYQWQWRASASGTWKDCSSATTGYNTATLKPVGTAARNGYQYRCIVKDASGNSVTSNTATLTVKTGLAITTQPASVSVTVGSTATFKVVATNASSYQWQWRASASGTWTNCSSATTGYNTATLKPVGTAARNGYQYRCVVKDANGSSIISNTATLTVKAASTLAITTQPASTTVSEGSTATFKVVATGAFSYQWQWRASSSGTWANCSSATTGYNTATLKPVGTSARNGYQYRCIVKDANGNSVTSAAATLTVKAALAITSQPASTTVSEGSTATFKVVATGASSYQWQWRASASGTWANCSSATTGYNTATLKPVGTAARNGYQYRCVVKDASGNSITSGTATLTVKTVLTITQQPESAYVFTGNYVSFEVTAAGTGLTYQWQYRPLNYTTWYTANMTGSTTNRLTVYANRDNSGYEYRCIVKDSSGSTVISKPVYLMVYSSSLYLTSSTGPVKASLGTSVVLNVTAVGPGLTYQWQYRLAGTDLWLNSLSAGYNTANLQIPITIEKDGMEFRCIIRSSNDDLLISRETIVEILN